MTTPVDARYAPAIEITPPGGEPMCFVLPDDTEQLAQELVKSWQAGAWRDLHISTVVHSRYGGGL